MCRPQAPVAIKGLSHSNPPNLFSSDSFTRFSTWFSIHYPYVLFTCSACLVFFSFCPIFFFLSTIVLEMMWNERSQLFRWNEKDRRMHDEVIPIHNRPSKSSCKQNASAHGRCRTAGAADRPQRVAGPTGYDCVSGVDLAVRRRIKWLIGVAGRGEGVKRSPPPPLLPFPLFFSLSLPQPAEKAIGAEQTNHMAIKHYSPPLHWDSIQTAFTGLCSVLIPASKRRTQTHANAHKCTHTHAHTHRRASPSTWQWFYKSPQCEVSYSPSSTRTTSAVQAQGKKGGSEGQSSYWTAPPRRKSCR